MKKPLVTVIMPVFNAERFVRKAIDSISEQTYSNWELLICDDASSDESYELIKNTISTRNGKFRLYKNASNQKLLKTRNMLLTKATGDLITFQDADDYSHIQRFEKMVDEFNRNSNLGLLSSQVGYVNEQGILLRESNKPTDYATTLELIKERNVVGGSVAMITRQALESVGGKFRAFLDGLSYQDYDLSMLIAEKYESYALPDVLYYYRQHPLSNSKMVDVDRIIARELVIHLGRQRRERGSDDVMDGKLERVARYFDELREPFRNDPSLVHREYAGQFMYNRLYKRAVGTAWKAVVTQPTKFVNWRTLQYCIRKSLLARFV